MKQRRTTRATPVRSEEDEDALSSDCDLEVAMNRQIASVDGQCPDNEH